ncbi:FecR domain-containing protein [soil metagenome]
MSDQLQSAFDPPSPDWDAVARFVAGEGTPDERAAMAHMLAQHPSRAALLDVLIQAGRAGEPVAPTSAEVEIALASVRSRAALDARTASAPRRAAVVSLDAYRTRWHRARLSAAAAVLLVAGAGLVWRAIAKRAPNASAADQSSYATAPGVMDSLTLPDGSRVLLGPGSRLTLAAGFRSGAREMSLAGEARFTVVHDTAHPFVIHTSSATVRDVGTVFSVHSDEAEGARVVVSEGVVEVQAKSGVSRQTLGVGDVAVIAVGGAIQVQRAAAGLDDLAWTQGRLVFRDASVTQVAADLRRWYGVEVKVDSVFAKRPVTANFDRGISAPDVARIIAATIGGTVREEGSVLHIIPVPDGAPVK